MIRFTLARKEIYQENKETKLGYNYYLMIYDNEKLVKSEVIHTSIGSIDPFNAVSHDAQAKNLYEKRINTKANQDIMSSNDQSARLNLGI